MNIIYKNIIRYGLIFLAMFNIAFLTPDYFKNIFGFGIIVMMAFCIGFILSQHIKDIERYLFKENS